VAVQPAVSGPAYDSPSYRRVNTIDTSAILGDGLLHTFLVNRNTNETAEVEIDHAGGKIESVKSAEVIRGSEPNASNTYENPNSICSGPLQTVKVSDGKASVQLPPLSVTAVTFKVSLLSIWVAARLTIHPVGRTCQQLCLACALPYSF
jgi:alpha-N-arabinofuranosidase